MRTLVLLMSISLLVSCDIRYPEFEYFISNRSTDSIFVYECPNDSFLPSQQPFYLYDDSQLIAPGATKKRQHWWYWDMKKKSMAVVILKAETINTLTWPVVQELDTIDCLMFYTLDDLKATNYMIEYKK